MTLAVTAIFSDDTVLLISLRKHTNTGHNPWAFLTKSNNGSEYGQYRWMIVNQNMSQSQRYSSVLWWLHLEFPRDIIYRNISLIIKNKHHQSICFNFCVSSSMWNRWSTLARYCVFDSQIRYLQTMNELKTKNVTNTNVCIYQIPHHVNFSYNPEIRGVENDTKHTFCFYYLINSFSQ